MQDLAHHTVISGKHIWSPFTQQPIVTPTQSDTDDETTESPRTAAPVNGPFPRIERQRTHHDFLWAVRPPAAMTNIIHARRMLMHGESADDFFPPETSVFLTTTIPDDDLMDYSFADEVRIVAEFAPDYYLPFDFPVYGDMEEETRMDHIRQVGGGTLDMARLLDATEENAPRLADETGVDVTTVKAAAEADTELVPLIKGTTASERNVMERVAEEIDASMIAKYGTQYMTVPGSGNYPALRRTLEAINDETDGFPVIVIGLLSPTGKYSLEGLPDNVCGAAGLNQWRAPVDPAQNTPSEMRDAYADLDREVAEALGHSPQYDTGTGADTGDSPLNEFVSDTSSAVSTEDGSFSTGHAGIAASAEERFNARKQTDAEGDD